MRQRQPFVDVLRRRTLSQLWLARTTGYSHSHTRNVGARVVPASARFRARVADALDLPEADLFHQTDSSSVPPGERGGDDTDAEPVVMDAIYQSTEALSIRALA